MLAVRLHCDEPRHEKRPVNHKPPTTSATASAYAQTSARCARRLLRRLKLRLLKLRLLKLRLRLRLQRDPQVTNHRGSMPLFFFGGTYDG